MTGLRTWWRRYGGLLAVLLAFVLVVPTAVDAAICGLEGSAVAGAAADGHGAAKAAAPAKADAGQKAAIGDVDAACHHGHCHHGGVGVPAPAADAVRVLVAATAPPPSMARAPPSHPFTRLDRPPRG